MRLRVDRELCLGTGVCALIAPEVFDQDDDEGKVTLIDAAPRSAADASAARRAANQCPAGAIVVGADDDTR
ncbi:MULTISPECIES: ferredoxin [unclassified Streptomyces]|uniref:ferredoxin n=1 Tax=unclassified Streptomyces TaxID=2593676 RepID=UPI00365BD776